MSAASCSFIPGSRSWRSSRSRSTRGTARRRATTRSHYLKDGIKLEVLWSPPAVLAARLPGMGHDFQQHLLNYDRMAPFDVIVAAGASCGA